MNTDIFSKIEKAHIRKHLPAFEVGDTVEVTMLIKEGEKSRQQKFRGLVIAIHGSGTRKMVTLRKISYGIGVEKIIPINSPLVSDMQILKYGKVRRSKIYFIRERVGKKAMKVKIGKERFVEVNEGVAEEAVAGEDIVAEDIVNAVAGEASKEVVENAVESKE